MKRKLCPFLFLLTFVPGAAASLFPPGFAHLAAVLPAPPPAPPTAAVAPPGAQAPQTQTCDPPPPGTHCVDLTWNASPTAGVTYNVWRSTTANACSNPANKITTGITGTYFGDLTVANGATYFYAITAQNSGGQSACTSDVQVLIGVPPSGATNPNAIPH